MKTLSFVATLVACGASIAVAQVPDRPALVVLIAIDQFRGDYLDRWAPQWTGGLARLRNQGAFYPNAIQDHAVTETAPGHATILSGREPVHTHIVSNALGVPDASFRLIGSTGTGASPRRFVGTTLYDWLVANDRNARALSISRKDRGAILPIGSAKADVFWWSNGKFTTSTFYADALPAWLIRFNAGIRFDDLAGQSWDLLLPPSAYPEPDSVRAENNGSDFVFPHALPGADALPSQLPLYPHMDSITLAAALAGVKATELGRRALASNDRWTMPDLLAVSLSTTDAIGHAFGPDSREIHDQALRVDRWLGAFMAALERDIPARRILYVMTADHGVTPLPEIAKLRGGGQVALSDLAAAAESALRRRHGTSFGLMFSNGLIYADLAKLRAVRINVDSLGEALVKAATSRSGVRMGFTRRTLGLSNDEAAPRWRRSLPPSLGWVAAFEAAPGYLWSEVGQTSADHSTPNRLSLSVPIAFLGWNVERGRYKEVVRTVDIAPTLAMLLGIEPLEGVDGVALRAVERRKSTNR